MSEMRISGSSSSTDYTRSGSPYPAPGPTAGALTMEVLPLLAQDATGGALRERLSRAADDELRTLKSDLDKLLGTWGADDQVMSWLVTIKTAANAVTKARQEAAQIKHRHEAEAQAARQAEAYRLAEAQRQAEAAARREAAEAAQRRLDQLKAQERERVAAQAEASRQTKAEQARQEAAAAQQARQAEALRLADERRLAVESARREVEEWKRVAAERATVRETARQAVEAEAASTAAAEEAARSAAAAAPSGKARWYYSLDGANPVGPVTSTQMRALIAAGELTPDHLVSLDGTKWKRAARLQGAPWPAQPAG